MNTAPSAPAPTGYRAALVTLYVTDNPPAIPAYIRDESHAMWAAGGALWNGWVLPIFPEDTFTAHREEWQELFPEGSTDEQTVSWPIWTDDVPSIVFHYEDESEQQVEHFGLEGVGYYSVGSGMVWEEVEH